MQYEPEMYRPPTATPSATMADDTKLAAAFQVITWIVLGTVLVVWAVVGFIFWLPFLLKEMALFSMSLIQSTTTGADLEPAGEQLKGAIQFYRRGFELAYSTVMKDDGPPSNRPPIQVNAAQLAKQGFWALVAWWLVLSVLGLIDWTPLALGRWFISGAWLQALDSLAMWFMGWLDVLFGAAGGGGGTTTGG